MAKLIFLNIEKYNEFNDLINDREKWNSFIEDNYKTDESIDKYIIYNRI